MGFHLHVYNILQMQDIVLSCRGPPRNTQFQANQISCIDGGGIHKTLPLLEELLKVDGI